MNPHNMPNMEKVWKELAKYDIHSEADLDKHMATMPRLNITCMVSKVKKVKVTEEK